MIGRAIWEDARLELRAPWMHAGKLRPRRTRTGPAR